LPRSQAHASGRPERSRSGGEDPYDDPVDLQDIKRAAQEIAPAADADWH
jgi:hypothetical protein